MQKHDSHAFLRTEVCGNLTGPPPSICHGPQGIPGEPHIGPSQSTRPCPLGSAHSALRWRPGPWNDNFCDSSNNTGDPLQNLKWIPDANPRERIATQRNAMPRRNARPRNATRHKATPCNGMQCHAMRYITMQCNAILQCNALMRGPNATQCGIAILQCSAVM